MQQTAIKKGALFAMIQHGGLANGPNDSSLPNF
jgi:hypothetical protein